MPDNRPHNLLKHHVSGAIARGEKQAITEVTPGALTREELQALPEVSGKYGAPMGRHGDTPDSDYAGLVWLEPILDPCPNADGAYDYGGAYWGCGKMVWRAMARETLDRAESSWVTYFRGPSPHDDPERVADAARAHGWQSARFEIVEPLGGCKADFDGVPCEWCEEMESSHA